MFVVCNNCGHLISLTSLLFSLDQHHGEILHTLAFGKFGFRQIWISANLDFGKFGENIWANWFQQIGTFGENVWANSFQQIGTFGENVWANWFKQIGTFGENVWANWF